MIRADLPYAPAGATVGLLGGSFDPAHAGHVRITREALKRFRLDRVWWLVSPGNPLKQSGPAALDARLARARAVMRHPRVQITGIEARLGTQYTAETLAALARLYPRLRFVWLMGADNLAQFDQWEQWRAIMHSVPVGVIARPGARGAARTAKAARVFRAARLPGRAAGLLSGRAAPAWAHVNVPMCSLSSSAIRASGDW